MDESKGSLPIKHRPKRWEDFWGNETTVESLRSVLNRKEGRPHCLLFEGPSGCGKTTLARMVARELGCSDRDFYEMNISDMRGIDTAREVIRNSRFAPMMGDVKVYVLNEVHKATNEFSNAMLDVLEFPPDHVYFLLCTTDPQKILPTIRGQRAQVFKVAPLPTPVMIKFIRSVVEKEGIDHFPDGHYKEMAFASDGSPRAALTILDKIIDIEDLDEALGAIATAGFNEIEVKDIIDYLMSPGKKNWKKMSDMIKKLDLTSDNPEKVRLGMGRYFGSVLLNRGDKRSYELMSLFVGEPWFYGGRERMIDALYLACQM